MDEEWIQSILNSTKIPDAVVLNSAPSIESILEQFAHDDDTYNEWLAQLNGYVLRSHSDELFLGDHTKYLDIKDPDNPILRKGGMLVRFDEDTGLAFLRMGAHIWSVKAETTVFFQKPGKQARILEMFSHQNK